MQTPSKFKPGAKTRKPSPLVLFVLIPVISCGLSSIIGIILGQVGNLVHAALGQVSACLTVPGFLLLFGVSFGLSFLASRLLRGWLS